MGIQPGVCLPSSTNPSQGDQKNLDGEEILLTAFWPKRSWFSALKMMAEEDLYILPNRDDLLLVRGSPSATSKPEIDSLDSKNLWKDLEKVHI